MAGTMNDNDGIHIGHIIKSVFDASGMTVSELARQIHCERTNVYKIFNRRSIDVELLVKISEILNHNFLTDVMRCHGFEIKTVNKLCLNVTFDDISDENIAIMAKTIESFQTSKKKM
jgi:transcriptional regulator with XRE-family HTH domain